MKRDWFAQVTTLHNGVFSFTYNLVFVQRWFAQVTTLHNGVFSFTYNLVFVQRFRFELQDHYQHQQQKSNTKYLSKS